MTHLRKITGAAIVATRLFTSVLFFGAEAQPFTTHLYTTADGLSDNYIFSIYQDYCGYLWIGTANGLNRFDGTHFTNYGLRQGLPSILVDRVYEDRRHRLWIGTRAGIAELKGDSCEVYPVSDHQVIGYVSSFLEPDSSKLWATTDKGLYELRNHRWVKISLYPGYENESIGKIIRTKDGFLINYNNNKLLQITKNGQSKFLLSVPSSNPFYNGVFVFNDTIYVSTYSGLIRLQDNRWSAVFPDSLQKRYIYHSFMDREKRWWFGTKQDGVLIAIPNNERTDYVQIPLSFNLVSNFFEDRDHNIWVAGLQGLLKVSPSYYRMVSNSELDQMKFIRNCIELPSGKMVVSGENGKLLIFQSHAGNDNLPTLIGSKQLKGEGDFIDFYTFDDEQRMWFSTRAGRLYRFDGLTLEDFSSIVPFKNNYFRGLAYNKQTKQLFVCADSVLLSGNEHRLDTFFSRDRRRFIPLPNILRLNKDNGSLIVQTIGYGAYLINSSGDIKALAKELNFSISTVTTGEQAGESFIWAAYTGKNLTKYRWGANNEITPTEVITQTNGLPNNKILSIVADGKKLWIATARGLRLLEKKETNSWGYEDFDINTYGNSDPFAFAKLARDLNGNIWISARNQLFVFDSRTIVHPIYSNTVIEKISINNLPTNWGRLTSSVESYRQLPTDAVLKYKQNTLSISFNALQFNGSSQIEYSYRLKPADSLWSNPVDGNVVSFYQLNPGKYQFEVRSHIKGFDWSEPATFSFEIEKPFWETWWFRVSMIAIAAALIITIFRYRLKQLRAKSEIQNQLHEMEAKAFKLQMNPHFVYNALNSIQSLVLAEKSKEASHYIGKFAKLLRQVLENSEQDLIDLDKELYSLQLYVDLEKWRMNSDVEYIVERDYSVTNSEIKIPPLILQPFVENALWHGLSRKVGQKRIVLTIASEQNWLIFRVKDNGIGRRKAEEFYHSFPEGHLSRAVNIIKHRLSDFNKPFEADPVTYLDLEQNDVSSGTEVIIRIKNLNAN